MDMFTLIKNNRWVIFLLFAGCLVFTSALFGVTQVYAKKETKPWLIDFENGKTGGFKPCQVYMDLTVTSEQAHSGKIRCSFQTVEKDGKR
jgi:hypothetical protein